jgi:hypothetical protein
LFAASLSAADRLAKYMRSDLNASCGQLWDFSKCRGIVNGRTFREYLIARTEEIKPFRKFLNGLTEKRGLIPSQIHNGDEAGLLWHLLPENTQTYAHGSSQPRCKINDERMSFMTSAIWGGIS